MGLVVFNLQVETDGTGYQLVTISSEPGDAPGDYRAVAYDQVTGLFAESTFIIEQITSTLPPQITFDTSVIDYTPGEDTGDRVFIDFVYQNGEDHDRIIVQNTGGVPVQLASFEFISPNAEDFLVRDDYTSSSSLRIIGANLNPQQSCYFYLIFKPLGIGERQSTFVLSAVDNNGTLTTTEVYLHGFSKVNLLGIGVSAPPLSPSGIAACYQLVN